MREYVSCREAIAGLSDIDHNSVDMIFLDPPYNLGVDYGEGKEADKLPSADYNRYFAEFYFTAYTTVRPGGSMWVVISDEFAAEHCVSAKAAGFKMRNWIKWYETFGVNCLMKFNRTSRHILYFVRPGGAIRFYPKRVNTQSARQRLGDKRANPNGKTWDDVWQIPRLVGNARERLPGFPTQLPIALVEPCVLCCTDVGDLVVDPFSGSGTTGMVAIKYGRRFVGFDLSEKFAKIASKRIWQTIEE